MESEVTRLRRDLDRARRDRDHTAALLLDAKQRAATAVSENGALMAHIASLNHEIGDLHSSTSWRATRWLRALGRARRKGR